MYIYISSSWKNRLQVRELAKMLRSFGHEVYDFTDPSCRSTPEIPPEKFPEPFDPEVNVYQSYLDRPEWRAAVEENRIHIERAELIVLLLPAGIDATADWALGLNHAKSIVIGHPKAGERSPVHLWADWMFESIDDALSHIYYTFLEDTEQVGWILRNSTSDHSYKLYIPELSDDQLSYCLIKEKRSSGRKMLLSEAKRRKIVCRVCGCSEFNPCEGGCCWSEPGLCSRCAEALCKGDGGELT